MMGSRKKRSFYIKADHGGRDSAPLDLTVKRPLSMTYWITNKNYAVKLLFKNIFPQVTQSNIRQVGSSLVKSIILTCKKNYPCL